MKNLKIFVIALIVLSSLTSSKLVLAQSSDTTYLPSRGKHIFTSVQYVDDPFVSTKFLLGFGNAEIIETEIPITIGDSSGTVKFEPDISYVTGGAEFQYAIRDWAAVRVKYFALAKLGNNFLSLASEGVSAASTFNIGWLFRIAENENIMFSGAIDLNTADLTYVNILGPKDTTITPVDTLINRQLITNYQSLTTQADLRLAVRFSDVFGLVTKLSGGYGDAYAGERESKFQYNFGIAFSIDLRNWIRIPFGIGLGGSLISNDWRTQEAKPPVYSANLNIAFYNRNDFTLGVENYIKIVESQKYNQSFNYLNTRIYMSYYF
jgi:hypothetical protein